MTIKKAIIKGMAVGTANVFATAAVEKVRKKLTRNAGVPIKVLSYIGTLGIDFMVGCAGGFWLLRATLDDGEQDEWKYENPNIFKEV